jgi:hypothetical protein
MAVVLEVSLTLNPNNQIAYLADFTSLIEDTEYIINATYIGYDTRFVFHGNLDITLTKPPIGVPASGTIVPAEISTVPTAATPPPPPTYPYSTKDRLVASNLNIDFEFSPNTVPPHSLLGGAGKFKYWVDTSTALPSLRQCIVPRASTTYTAAEWILLGTIDAAAHKFHFNGDVVDFVGGGGTSNIFNVTNLAVSGASNLTTLNVAGASTLTTLNVGGATTLSSTLGVSGATTLGSTLNVSGATTLGTLNISGATTMTGDLTVPTINFSTSSGGANRFALGWNGAHVTTWIGGVIAGTVPSALPVPIAEGGTSATSAAAALANLGGFPNTGGTLNGALNVNGNITTGGVVQGNYLHSTGWVDGTYVHSTGAVTADGTVTGGYLHSTGHVDADGILHAAGGQMSMGNGGLGRRLSIDPGWYWEWNSSNGDLIWGGPSGAQFWVTRYSDRYCGNQIGPVFGNGAYINFSDARGKTDIAPAKQGLDEIMKLKPVSFRRVREEGKAGGVELGFTAQDVQEVLPEAVHPLEAGADPHLGVSLDPIVVSLVNAVQHLVARLEALEGAR